MRLTILFAVAAMSVSAVAYAVSPRETILENYAKEAGGATFSLERGKAFFEAAHTGGKPATPSCTTCHGKDPRVAGQTRTGKVIEPMAASANPERFTDPAFIEKWFSRNCDTVLGRSCTATEKGDVITYLSRL